MKEDSSCMVVYDVCRVLYAVCCMMCSVCCVLIVPCAACRVPCVLCRGFVCVQLGDEVNLFEGQASILFDSYEKSGPVDVDRYSLKLEGLLEADIYVRPAHPLLQHKDDAMVHLNLDIAEVHHRYSCARCPRQTHAAKEESEESNLDYNVLRSSSRGRRAARRR